MSIFLNVLISCILNKSPSLLIRIFQEAKPPHQASQTLYISQHMIMIQVKFPYLNYKV